VINPLSLSSSSPARFCPGISKKTSSAGMSGTKASKTTRAGSSGVRKELGELLGWFHESERLARAIVEARRDAGEILGGVHR
jgi:hypothetical protein